MLVLKLQGEIPQQPQEFWHELAIGQGIALLGLNQDVFRYLGTQLQLLNG